MNEYKVERVFIERLDDFLQTQAAEGWEIVTMTQLNAGVAQQLLVVMKRDPHPPYWQCGCGEFNSLANVECKCALCKRPRQ